jgi:hypothetical protein
MPLVFYFRISLGMSVGFLLYLQGVLVYLFWVFQTPFCLWAEALGGRTIMLSLGLIHFEHIPTNRIKTRVT